MESTWKQHTSKREKIFQCYIWQWKLRSSGVWGSAVRYEFTELSEGYNASIFKCLACRPWRLWQYAPQKSPRTSTGLNGVTSQRTAINQAGSPEPATDDCYGAQEKAFISRQKSGTYLHKKHFHSPSSEVLPDSSAIFWIIENRTKEDDRALRVL